MKLLEGRRAHGPPAVSAYGGDDWFSMRSAAREVAEHFNANPNLTCDAGAVLFGNTVTVTADGPWQHLLHELTGRKWGNLDVENETGCGVVPYVYKEKNLVNAIQWAVGLELLLLITDPWRICLTTDHPNGATFWRLSGDRATPDERRVPQGTAEAVSGEGPRPNGASRSHPQYTLNDIAIITSAGPRRAAGSCSEGHLGPGADADVAIFNENANAAEMFSYPRYVIKSGQLIVEEGERGTLLRAASSRSSPPTTRPSRTTSDRCSSSTTRCRSRITPCPRSGCTGSKWWPGRGIDAVLPPGLRQVETRRAAVHGYCLPRLHNLRDVVEHPLLTFHRDAGVGMRDPDFGVLELVCHQFGEDLGHFRGREGQFFLREDQVRCPRLRLELRELLLQPRDLGLDGFDVGELRQLGSRT